MLALVALVLPAVVSVACATIIGLDSGGPYPPDAADGTVGDGMVGDAGSDRGAADADAGVNMDCGAGDKFCGKCVGTSDPSYGCSPTMCASCPGYPFVAMPACEAGTCVIGACQQGYANCSGNPTDGCNVHTASNAQHCGSCTNVCPEGGVCVDGGCSTSCPSPTTNCSGSCVNLGNDWQNCTACGMACPVFPNTSPTCANSMCGFMCSANYADCNKDASDGCECPLNTHACSMTMPGACCLTTAQKCTQNSECCSNACVLSGIVDLCL